MFTGQDQGPAIDLQDLGFDGAEEPEHHGHRQQRHQQHKGNAVAVPDSLDNHRHDGLQHLMEATHEIHGDDFRRHHSVPHPLLIEPRQQQQQQHSHHQIQSQPQDPPQQHDEQQQQQHETYTHAQEAQHHHHYGLSMVHQAAQEVEATMDDDANDEDDDDVPPPKPRPAKRRRYNNDFKAEVLDVLKIPGVKLPAVAKQFNVPENTVREWTKASAIQKVEAARAKHSGHFKANVSDPMHRITKSLANFFDQNERQPQHIRQPVTTKLIVVKGLAAKNKLLELDQIQPFLDPMERKALTKFTASDSWAKKFAKKHCLKMTGARIKELSTKDVTEFHDSLEKMALRIKQAGPRYEEAANLIRLAGEKLALIRSGKMALQASGGKSDPPRRGKVLLNTTKTAGEQAAMSSHDIASPLQETQPHSNEQQDQQQAHGQQSHLQNQERHNIMTNEHQQQQSHSREQGDQQFQTHQQHILQQQQQQTQQQPTMQQPTMQPPQQQHVEDPLRIMFTATEALATAPQHSATQETELPEAFQPM